MSQFLKAEVLKACGISGLGKDKQMKAMFLKESIRQGADNSIEPGSRHGFFVADANVFQDIAGS